MKKLMLAAFAASTLAFAAPSAAFAQDQYPLKGAEWIDVTGISIEDGGGLRYAQWLATEWRKRLDFQVEKGWIESYEIWSNTYPRENEPNLWLVVRYNDWTDDETWETRGREMREYMAQSIAQLNEESGNRAQYRKVGSEVLIKRLVWRD